MHRKLYFCTFAAIGSVIFMSLGCDHGESLPEVKLSSQAGYEHCDRKQPGLR